MKPGEVKTDFPLLAQEGLIYLDSAATSQKPTQVLKAINHYYQTQNANVHRGVHRLSDLSTTVYQQARETISNFFGANSDELILTRNTTEAINGIAYGWADHNLQAGDTILASLLEHHSNLVVWQQVAKRTGCNLELVSLTSDGQLDLADLQQKLQQFSVKLISLVHVSNTTGAVLPVAEITKILDEVYQNSDRQKPRIVLDGAQSAPHLPINFSNLEVDFYAFSGHKMLGPMGIGGLLVRREILESGEMQPWLFGGGMISEVYSDHTIFHSDLSDRFTAGTPDVACAVGLAAACDYLSAIGMSNVLTHDQNLVEYALEKLSKIPQIHLIGPLTAKSENNHPNRLGSVAFLFEGVHAHDVAQVLDSVGVAVRSGHHCTMPLHLANNWVATTRASFQVYNSEEDIDTLIDGLSKVAQVFKNV